MIKIYFLPAVPFYCDKTHLRMEYWKGRIEKIIKGFFTVPSTADGIAAGECWE